SQPSAPEPPASQPDGGYFGDGPLGPTLDWSQSNPFELKRADVPSSAASQPLAPEPPVSEKEEVPDWLADLRDPGQSVEDDESELPDWLRRPIQGSGREGSAGESAEGKPKDAEPDSGVGVQERAELINKALDFLSGSGARSQGISDRDWEHALAEAQEVKEEAVESQGEVDGEKMRKLFEAVKGLNVPWAEDGSLDFADYPAEAVRIHNGQDLESPEGEELIRILAQAKIGIEQGSGQPADCPDYIWDASFRRRDVAALVNLYHDFVAATLIEGDKRPDEISLEAWNLAKKKELSERAKRLQVMIGEMYRAHEKGKDGPPEGVPPSLWAAWQVNTREDAKK
ncbi:MAG: hypothetical protein JW991_02155, partial [Candidatus Pacebacteria bacterium]|nr:hypothetical protein [Candidatus Paceibacterota bacterium]